jgi:Zn-dependent M28 family amino/carboxypeptidase
MNYEGWKNLLASKGNPTSATIPRHEVPVLDKNGIIDAFREYGPVEDVPLNDGEVLHYQRDYVTPEAIKHLLRSFGRCCYVVFHVANQDRDFLTPKDEKPWLYFKDRNLTEAIGTANENTSNLWLDFGDSIAEVIEVSMTGKAFRVGPAKPHDYIVYEAATQEFRPRLLHTYEGTAVSGGAMYGYGRLPSND